MLSPKALTRLQYSVRPKAFRNLANKTFQPIRKASTMKALVYNGPGSFGLEDKPKPTLQGPKDAIVKLQYTTICGTDLHILHGDNLTSKPGTILGHEGVGIVEEIGAGISNFKKGDQVMISCISSCGTCEYCRRNMYSHCVSGGWVLGNTIDGTQAEYVRIPVADSSLYKVPESVDAKTMVMLSDIFPTGFECGVINGKVQPGSTVCIIGSGPVGLAALLTAQLYSPAWVMMIDPDHNRLKVARLFGAQHISEPELALKHVQDLTDGKGVDTVIEAVGIPATFAQCQELVAPGGIIANVGVHGVKADLHLETLWAKNIAITTRLVDTSTTPMLLKLLVAGKLPAAQMITHTFKFTDMLKAYETFKDAADTKALKVLIEM